jgi:SAM-dependent methyltransferase
MNGYYSQKLSAEQLRRCYEIAPPRVKRYLEAEIEFVLDRIKPSDLVLELGCGYGRVLKRLVKKTRTVVGIDNSYLSLSLARETMGKTSSCHLLAMNAVELGFNDRVFDMVICIQNGLSAFKVDQRKLIEEAMRVTHSPGTVLFSSYSARFWKDRLEWFRLQAEEGLIGEIDEEATGDGVIVCKDGFKATTLGPADFISLISGLDTGLIITEVDGSSIFYEIRVK